ncbi:MAG: electron transfer flavoprotein subunit beta/FixA family protein [Dehalococcoidia bacterium]|nr:electron transfer flavoprotein subunit beta/FixA family protein [Dehalococcoidia bacterium]
MPELKMVVCCKQVLDPEAPPKSFKIDPSSMRMTLPADIKPVIGQYDEFALEAALRVRTQVGGTVTVLSLGNNMVRDVIKKSLAVGADELVLLEDAAFEESDSWSTAYALSKAVQKLEGSDVIFCGRQSSDWDAGQVGPGLAELLGLPLVTLARKVEAIDGGLRIEQVIPDGYQVVEVPTPVVVTVTSELGNLRYAILRGIMAAAKKQPVVWTPSDLGLEPSEVGAQGRRLTLSRLYQPVKEARCDIVEGETPAEAGANLALRLREAKVI